jgi:hypothetical protein
MLEHALQINAQEQYQRLIVAMAPNMRKEDRQKVFDSYMEIINGKEKGPSAIIRDRERLRKIFNKK